MTGTRRLLARRPRPPRIGGILTATLLEGVELHIEMADGKLEAAMYRDGKRYETDLRFWQGKGAYLIRNPGQSQEQTLRNRDDLFNKHAQTPGQLISPAYDYTHGQPQYLGAVRTVQSVDPTYATLGDYVHVPIVDELVDMGTSTGIGVIASRYLGANPKGAGVGAVSYFFQVLLFSTIATYQNPRVYSCGWSLPSAPIVNSEYPWGGH